MTRLQYLVFLILFLNAQCLKRLSGRVPGTRGTRSNEAPALGNTKIDLKEPLTTVFITVFPFFGVENLELDQKRHSNPFLIGSDSFLARMITERN